MNSNPTACRLCRDWGATRSNAVPTTNPSHRTRVGIVVFVGIVGTVNNQTRRIRQSRQRRHKNCIETPCRDWLLRPKQFGEFFGTGAQRARSLPITQAKVPKPSDYVIHKNASLAVFVQPSPRKSVQPSPPVKREKQSAVIRPAYNLQLFRRNDRAKFIQPTRPTASTYR